MMRQFISAFLILVGAVTAVGQLSVSGCMYDSATGERLPGVVVRAYSGGRLKAFATAKADGRYTLKIPAVAVDSVELRLQCIGYEKHQMMIANRTAVHDFRLTPSATSLREVQVSIPRIRQVGDTLTYNLASYLGKGDVTLEDGLKKLPGVEVESSGKINYQGRGISNFYIEGMDMLGGRYNQATRNLPASYVTDVEVLNNHHDAKIDKGKHTDDVAINVKLKSKVKFKPVGTRELLAGYGGGWRYRLANTSMMFTPKFQCLLSLKGGNFNRFALGELTEHFTISHYSGSKEGLAARYLGSPGGSKPPMKADRYISPNDRTVSVNFMRKFNDERSLKVNASYAYSSTDYGYSQTSEYYAGENVVVVNERNRPASRVNKPSLDLDYRENGEKRYVANRFSASAIFQRDNFNTLSEGLDLRQRRTLDVFDISNDFSWRIKSGGRDWSLGLNLAYNNSPEADLSVTSIADPSQSAVQTMSGNRFYSRFGASTNRSYGGWRIYFPINAEFVVDRVKSMLDDAASVNDVRGSTLCLGASPSFQYTAPGRRFELSGSISAGLLSFHGHNKHGEGRAEYDRPYLNPRLRMKYSFNPNFAIIFNSNLTENVGDVLNLLTEPVMTSWRSRRASSGILARDKVFSSGLGVDFKKPMDLWFARADVSYSDTRRNILGSQYVSSSQVTVSGLAADNSSKSFNGSLSVTKHVIEIGGKFTVAGNCQWSRSEIMQQERVIPYFGRSFSLSSRIVLAPWKWSELNTNVSFSKNYSRYLAVRESYDMLGCNAKLSVFPASGWEIFGVDEYMRKQLADGGRKSFSLFDLGVSYKYENFRFTLRADNLLDTRDYYYSVYGGLDSYSYSYSLRPRTFSIGVTITR